MIFIQPDVSYRIIVFHNNPSFDSGPAKIYTLKNQTLLDSQESLIFNPNP